MAKKRCAIFPSHYYMRDFNVLNQRALQQPETITSEFR